MDWTEIIIKVSVEDLEKASAIAQMAASNGIYIEDYSNFEEEVKEFGPIEIIEQELLEKDKNHALIHIYINPEENPAEIMSYINDRFKYEEIKADTMVKNIKEEDWANNWKKYFKPIEVGNKLVIKPSWETYNGSNDRMILEIDPGMAFGSGTHESTRLCLASLEKFIKNNDEVLDLGCGSGILSVAALLLGAKHVFAVDIDPLAVKITKDNMGINGMNASRYTVVEGNMLTSEELINQAGCKKYDIILANIVADVIIAFTPLIANLLKEGGIVISSGIIEEREEDVKGKMLSHGFEVIEVNRDRGWISLVCKK